MKKTLWSRNYTLLTIGTILGATGGILSSFALSFLVYDETQSTLAAASLIAIQIIPNFLIPLLLAPTMDRLPRKPFLVGGDAINGVDVRYIDLEYLRSKVGVVTQDTYLFNGTIKENLLYAKADASDEELIDACKTANIYDFILNQPEGFDTMVGNRGLKLSGGEKQRLSLARVILKNPRILILDEATSALDSISENSIQNALEAMMQGRTSIVIAHRLSTILKADKILVVKDGVIAEQGAHEELLELGGVYKNLYETQFRQILDMEAEDKKEADDK